MREHRDWRVFLSSVFFVLGFSVVFSFVGVLLQSVLAEVAATVQIWLSRIGGAIIILFGLFLLGLLKIPFLEKEHKISVRHRFRSSFATSFVFGAAFAVGWTPCVGAILGAILTLAVAHPSSAFFLMLAYSLGLGIPFLLVGLFANESQRFLSKEHAWLIWVERFFGAFLVFLGALVFTNRLGLVANWGMVSDLLIRLNVESIFSGTSLSIGIAFIAGLLSFLSPCVLPLVPAFLAYLATTVVNKNQ